MILALTLLLSITLPAATHVPGAEPVKILTATLPYAVEGYPYEEGLITCAGGVPPYSWRIASGVLPGWATGPDGSDDWTTIGGTPPVGAPVSTTFSIQVSDQLSQTATQELTLVVADDFPGDYWNYMDLPDLTEDQQDAFADKTPAEWVAYYAQANQTAQALSDDLKQYILDWYYQGASPKIPYQLLPASISNAKTRDWTLLRPEEVDAADQWYIFPSFDIPADLQNLPAHSPDPHVTYLKMLYLAPLGSELLVEGDFPACRFMDYQISGPFDPEYPVAAEGGSPEVPLLDADIEPDPGHVNPFRVGADRAALQRHYHLTFTLQAGHSGLLNPEAMSGERRAPGNTRAGGPFVSSGAMGWGAIIPAVLWLRYYAPDDPGDPLAGVDLPKALLRLDSGETFWLQPDFSLAESRQSHLWPAPVSLPEAPPDEIGPSLGWFKVYDLTFIREEARGYKESPPWGSGSIDDLRHIIRSDMARLYKRGPQFEVPGGFPWGATMCEYIYYLTRPVSLGAGEVYVVTGKLPTTPDTRSGLTAMTAAEARYWSISHYVPWQTDVGASYLVQGDGVCVSSLMDDEVIVDDQNRYIIVYSRPEDKPGNALPEYGVTWQRFGPSAHGSLTVRWMATGPDHAGSDYAPDSANVPWPIGAWSQDIYDSSLVGTNQPGVMGEYHPILHYMTTAAFEALGTTLEADEVPPWEPGSHAPVVDSVRAAGITLTAPYSVTIQAGEALSVEVGASDPDDDSLTARAYLDGSLVSEPEASSAVGVTSGGGIYSLPCRVPPQSGQDEPYELVVVVSDGLQTRSAQIDITVNWRALLPMVAWLD